MKALVRRLRKLEVRLTDTNGLVPHSKEWLTFWSRRIEKTINGEVDDDPVPFTLDPFTLEASDAVREASEAEALLTPELVQV
jgi:hypothetical protein